MNLGALLDRAPAVRAGPSTAANLARNALGDAGDRAQRWAAARHAAWLLLERHVGSGARVAVIGAGHGNDLPLDRLAARAGTVDLLDLDRRALRRARSSCRAELRCRVRIVACDVTAGAADRITRAVCLGRPPRSSGRAPGPLAGGGYDVVIGDLLYSQLLYPALLDAGVGAARTRQALARLGPGLTDAVVSRMHASARPGGRVVHLHDAVGWWAGHEQPVGVGVILAQERLDDALALISTCRQPVGADPRESARRLGAKPIETALWEWPFAADARYLVCATVTEPG